MLIIFSIVFYAWGEPVWVILLLFSATLDYFNGRWIEKYRNTPKAKYGVICTLVVNLGLLIFFKYTDFLITNFNTLAGTQLPLFQFALPLGISFYVFMSISYTLDVWYGRIQAQHKFGSFLVYIANFHHLVAGPIIRYGHIASEVDDRKVTWQDFHIGISRFARGLFKKVFLANNAGILAESLLNQQSMESSILAGWLGLLLYGLQVYFDFSGYSDMAIGLGRMFGFKYHENFNYPYISRSITDFWRRWHISLSTFFKDYVYIPLGGNRSHQVRNILVVWLLTGIWHGASWNFILWGLYFAIILLIEKFLLLRWLDKLPRLIGHLYAIFFILLGWFIFYFTDLDKLYKQFNLLFGLLDAPLYSYQELSLLESNLYWLIFALLCSTPLFKHLEIRLFGNKGSLLALSQGLQTTLFLLISVSLLVGTTYNPFIYFRF